MKQATIDKSVTIDAPAAAVWNVLTTKDFFLDWTKAFNPTSESEVEGDFAPGAQMTFKDQSGAGLKAKVVDFTPAQSLTLEYLAEYVDGKEDKAGDWVGQSESYRLTEKDGRSALDIHQTLPQNYLAAFDKAWDDAVARIKELAESR